MPKIYPVTFKFLIFQSITMTIFSSANGRFLKEQNIINFCKFHTFTQAIAAFSISVCRFFWNTLILFLVVMAHWRIRSIKLISLIFRRLDRFRNHIIDTTYMCTHTHVFFIQSTLPPTRKYTFSCNITYSILYHRKKTKKMIGKKCIMDYNVFIF